MLLKYVVCKMTLFCSGLGVLMIEYNPDSKVDGANMGPTLDLSAPDGPHVGPTNLAIREDKAVLSYTAEHMLHLLLTAIYLVSFNTWYPLIVCQICQ